MSEMVRRRQRRRGLSDRQIASLPRKAKRYILADPEQRGLYLRVPSQGPVAFTAVARHNGKQAWATLGDTGTLTVEQARSKARAALARIRAGEDPVPPPP